MKFLYYIWESDGITTFSLRLTNIMPEKVEIDQKMGRWWFVTNEAFHPGYCLSLPIGVGTKDYCKQKSPLGLMFKDGCVAVIDQENLEHIQALQALAFHYGTEFTKLQRAMKK